MFTILVYYRYGTHEDYCIGVYETQEQAETRLNKVIPELINKPVENSELYSLHEKFEDYEKIISIVRLNK